MLNANIEIGIVMKNQVNDSALIVVGGGLTGLMSALKLRQKFPSKKIVVIEKSDQIGGKYGSLLYPGGIRFDNGMHVIYESCNPEVDDLYREVMPESEWNIYANNEKDIAGLFFNGHLQTYSHYVDLRTFPSGVMEKFIGSLFQNLGNSQTSKAKNAMDFLLSQFGKEVVHSVHRPILKMMYGVDPESLDVFATKVTALERVTLFDPSTMLDLMKSSILRARLAFPDQLNLPEVRENTQKALYPKKFGMSHFIEKLRDYLEAKEVEILTQTDITEIDLQKGVISQITLTNKEWGARSIKVDKVLWTAGWPSLARQLGVGISDLTFQKGPEMVFINLIFDRPVEMGRLYYFYCYDEGFASFRVTNYVNYCPAAAQDGRFPICVEFWPSKIGKKRSELGKDESIRLAMDELRSFGVIGPDHKLIFSEIEDNVGEFPMPTIENTEALKLIRNRVTEIGAENIIVAGIMADDGLFFIPDILNDAFAKLNDF